MRRPTIAPEPYRGSSQPVHRLTLWPLDHIDHPWMDIYAHREHDDSEDVDCFAMMESGLDDEGEEEGETSRHFDTPRVEEEPCGRRRRTARSRSSRSSSAR